MLNTFHQEPDPWDANQLKQTILQALNESQASNLVLQAELTLAQSQEEQNWVMAKKVKQKDKLGDWIVLSKDKMISCDHAEYELVAKKPAIAIAWKCHCQKKHQHEEEQVVAPPPATADDGDNAVDDGNKALLMSAMTPPPPPMHTFLDELDNGEPFSMISNNDPGSFGFFDTVLVASFSHIKH